jgi:ectoine hydroxylase-related dioxygenase (phytanoyl-CoA dioxygenase family)
MIGKSPICAENIINHPMYQAVCKVFLATKNWYWSGSKKIHATSDPTLNNSIAFSIGPGAWDQPLHRDSWCHQMYETEVDVYLDNCDHDVGWLIAGKPATKENGATQFIPGRHLWSKDRPPQEELAVHAELEPGVSLSSSPTNLVRYPAE